jgi:hypothetical protein
MSIFCWVSGLTLSPSLIHTDRRHLFDFLLQTRCIQSKQRKKIPGKRYIIFSLLLLVSLNSLFRLVIYPTINLNGFNLNYYPSIKINTHKRIETFEELIKKTKERNLKKQAEELVKTSPVNPTSVSTVAPRETQEPTSNRNLVDNHSQKDTRETGLSLDEIERNLNNFNNIQKTAPSHNTSQRKKTANDGLDNF